MNAINFGKVNVADLPVEYIVRDRNILILNTRTSQALTQAGIPRSQWNAIDRTGEALFEELADVCLLHNTELNLIIIFLNLFSSSIPINSILILMSLDSMTGSCFKFDEKIYWNPKHYIMYLDGVGMFQFIAQGYEVIEYE